MFKNSLNYSPPAVTCAQRRRCDGLPGLEPAQDIEPGNAAGVGEITSMQTEGVRAVTACGPAHAVRGW